MKLKDFIETSSDFDENLPVCFFNTEKNEYYEIESIDIVFDPLSQEWILSINEDEDSVNLRLQPHFIVTKADVTMRCGGEVISEEKNKDLNNKLHIRRHT